MFKLTKSRSLSLAVTALISVGTAFPAQGEQIAEKVTKGPDPKDLKIGESPELDKTLLEGLRTSKNFDSDLWIHEKYHGSRKAMIPDLTRSYPLIGMDRSGVHKLLGDPKPVDAWTEPNTELYDLPLGVPHCGLSVAKFLEIAYLDDKVSRFRLKQFHNEKWPAMQIEASQWVEKNLSWYGNEVASVSFKDSHRIRARS